jgi:hypothetical protein
VDLRRCGVNVSLWSTWNMGRIIYSPPLSLKRHPTPYLAPGPAIEVVVEG